MKKLSEKGEGSGRKSGGKKRLENEFLFIKPGNFCAEQKERRVDRKE